MFSWTEGVYQAESLKLVPLSLRQKKKSSNGFVVCQTVETAHWFGAVPRGVLWAGNVHSRVPKWAWSVTWSCMCDPVCPVSSPLHVHGPPVTGPPALPPFMLTALTPEAGQRLALFSRFLPQILLCKRKFYRIKMSTHVWSIKCRWN
jgi:hypothetical protein